MTSRVAAAVARQHHVDTNISSVNQSVNQSINQSHNAVIKLRSILMSVKSLTSLAVPSG